jgi:hypothetical protein
MNFRTEDAINSMSPYIISQSHAVGKCEPLKRVDNRKSLARSLDSRTQRYRRSNLMKRHCTMLESRLYLGITGIYVGNAGDSSAGHE